MATSNMSNYTETGLPKGLEEAFAHVNIQRDTMQNQTPTSETLSCANRMVIRYLLDKAWRTISS